jgi:hypothetical protein
MINNQKKLKTIHILKIIALFIISSILALIFFDTIKLLLAVALSSILIIGIYALYHKYIPNDTKNKLSSFFSFPNNETNHNNKSLKSFFIGKIYEIKNHKILHSIDQFINLFSELIFDLISLSFSKFINFTNDQDNFTSKGFLSKKILLKKYISLFLILSIIIIISQILFNTFKVASFTLVFVIQTLCILLPIIGLTIFISGLFYAYNKEKHDLIRTINKYFLLIDEKQNLQNYAKNIAQQFIDLSRNNNINQENIIEILNSTHIDINKILNKELNNELERQIIKNLVEKFFNNEQLEITKLNDLNNYELKQIKNFIEKIQERQQDNSSNSSESQTQTLLMKILEFITNKLSNENDLDKISNEISNIYYLALGKAYEFKNYIKEKM